MEKETKALRKGDSVEKYGFEKEWKEAVLIRKGNASTALVMDGEEVEICCPEIVRGNVDGKGTPCLVSGGKKPGDGKYSVMAFSLDHPNRENKDWICIKPYIFEEAVKYFLANNCMEEMVNGCTVSKKMENRGKAGADFIAGDAYIEINVPDAILNLAGDGWRQVKSLLLNAEKIAKYKNTFASLRETGRRIVFLTVFQHGLNEKMQYLLCRELSKFFGMVMDGRVSFWIADMRLEPDGIVLFSYQSITDQVLLS